MRGDDIKIDLQDIRVGKHGQD